jgi:hypothetical protein
MSSQRIRDFRWWLPVLAFAAGIAFHGAASANRAQTGTTEPTAAAAGGSTVVENAALTAQASSDTCDVQQD